MSAVLHPLDVERIAKIYQASYPKSLEMLSMIDVMERVSWLFGLYFCAPCKNFLITDGAPGSVVTWYGTGRCIRCGGLVNPHPKTVSDPSPPPSSSSGE